MSVTTPGWQQHLDSLLAAPADSAEHRLGEALSTADDAWSVLIDRIVQDPPNCPEYKAAARALGCLADSAGAA